MQGKLRRVRVVEQAGEPSEHLRFHKERCCFLDVVCGVACTSARWSFISTVRVVQAACLILLFSTAGLGRLQTYLFTCILVVHPDCYLLAILSFALTLTTLRVIFRHRKTLNPPLMHPRKNTQQETIRV